MPTRRDDEEAITLTAVTLLTALMIVVGLAGIVIPVLPGLLLVWAGVAVWAVARHDTAGWVTLGVATALALAGTLVKYLLPGRRMRSAGVGWPTLAAGAALGVVGFFVIPVVGVFVGFVLGIYLAERARLGPGTTTTPGTPRSSAADGEPPAGQSGPAGPSSAGVAVTPWQSTKAALVAVGWGIAIELVTGLLVTTTWVAALVVA